MKLSRPETVVMDIVIALLLAVFIGIATLIYIRG